MPDLVEPLQWDSDFFGFGIGRVALEGASPEMLRTIDTEARALGIACLYGSLDPAEPVTTYVVQEHGFRFVEAGLFLHLRRDASFAPPPTAARVRLGTPDDLPVLAEAVKVVAHWSRFAVDPRFGPEVALALHHAWLERAADPDHPGWQLVVAEEDDDIVAFSTQTEHPTPRIDFIGTTKPGSGAPYALVGYGREWAGERTLGGGPIAARNVAALRFVEHCGYRVAETRYHYHRWLDEHVAVEP